MTTIALSRIRNGRAWLAALMLGFTISGVAVAISSDPTSHDYGLVPVNTTVTRDFVMTIDPGYTVDRVQGGGTAAPFSVDLGTCTGFVGPGTCTLTQSFTPTSRFNLSGSFSLDECVGAACQSIFVSVQGTGVSVMAVDPTSIAFGDVALNTTATADITVTIDAGFSFAGAAGSATSGALHLDPNTCAGFAGPGTCTVKQSFTPRFPGAISTGLTVFECLTAVAPCGASLAKDIAVTGNGVGIPMSHDYGLVPVNTTVTHDFVMTIDPGHTVDRAQGSGTVAPFGIDLGTCAGFVGPGTCTLTQSFTPTTRFPNVSGAFNLVECFGADCQSIFVSVQGGGVSVMAVDQTSIAFGDVALNTAVSRDVTVTVDAGFRIGTVAGIGASAPFSVNLGTCAGFVGPGDCTLTDTYQPTIRGAVPVGGISIGTCPVATVGFCFGVVKDVAITGNAVSTFAATPATIDFGDVTINTTARQDIAVTLDTGYRFGIVAGSGVASPFGFDAGSCFGFVGPGTCTMTERWTPTLVGSATAGITIFSCPVGTTGFCTHFAEDVAMRGVGVLPTADLGLTLTGTPKPAQSRPVTYTIVVRNLGSHTAVASVMDTLPSRSQFLSATTTLGTCATPKVGATGVVYCSLGSMAAGATATVIVIVKPTVRNAHIVNSATVTSDSSTTDPVAANNSASLDLLVK